MHGTVVYEIDGTNYYVTTTQSKTVEKFSGEKKLKFIKKVAYYSGPPGGEVPSPEGTGRTAVLTASKSSEEPKGEEEQPEEEAEEEERVSIPSVADFMDSEKESGYHS